EPEALLFFTWRNGRRNKMSSDNVSRILKDCETAIRKDNPGLIHLHSHLFRRTRAMHLYLAGVPLPTISEWLGHSNIETTRFYYGKKNLMTSCPGRYLYLLPYPPEQLSIINASIR
ncbi:MAG: tyrosine-type recombinase/integrase, partial [Lachnospiraceae bacterium]|nr:tyrosine-type recombinase/integrase [Lachnospiraceae bacterium]